MSVRRSRLASNGGAIVVALIVVNGIGFLAYRSVTANRTSTETPPPAVLLPTELPPVVAPKNPMQTDLGVPKRTVPEAVVPPPLLPEAKVAEPVVPKTIGVEPEASNDAQTATQTLVPVPSAPKLSAPKPKKKKRVRSKKKRVLDSPPEKVKRAKLPSSEEKTEEQQSPPPVDPSTVIEQNPYTRKQ